MNLILSKLIFFIIISTAAFFAYTKAVYATIVINEFSSSTSDDWVEIYNTDTITATISGLKIRDETNTNHKDLSGELASGGFTVINFNSWLNNSGDTVKLVSVDGNNETVLDSISYGTSGDICVPDTNGSIGRYPDGGNIIRFASSTKGGSNNSSNQSDCITPTPIPSHTPVPSNTPVPSHTPKPANPIVLSSTPKPQVNNSPSNILEPAVKISPTLVKTLTLSSVNAASGSDDEILLNDGEVDTSSTANVLAAQEVKPENIKESANSMDSKILPVAFIAGGGISMTIAAWTSYVKLKKKGSDSLP